MNKLSLMQNVSLHEFLRADTIETIGSSCAQLAAKATAALGFTVTEGNVNGLRSAMGLNPNKDKPKKLRVTDWIARFESDISGIRSELAALKKELGAQ
jgi:hypothetical protein